MNFLLTLVSPFFADIEGMPSPPPLPSSEAMTGSYESAFLRMVLTLGGLIVLVIATFWILRKLGQGRLKMGSGRGVNVLEKRALSPKTMLYVVEIEGKKVVLSESQLEVRSIATIEIPQEESE
ncbi:MAG: flagellar biosynthetic protein FliO [Verrucomicrobia bacterium]|nr:flagellar biosynthetic protein FliO [Verrucomicrobiota bacterium]